MIKEVNKLRLIRKFLGLTQAQLADIMKVGQNTISMIENNKNSLVDRNKEILCNKLHINPQWLDNGIGEMFIDPEAPAQPSPSLTAQQYLKLRSKSQAACVGVPFFGKASAEALIMVARGDAPEKILPDYYVDLRPFNECTFFRMVNGDAMSPRFRPGDMIACQRVLDRSVLLFGEPYLCIIVNKDKSAYETIRIIRQSQLGPNYLILKSVAQGYDDIEVPAQAIAEIFLIKGRIERMQ